MVFTAKITFNPETFLCDVSTGEEENKSSRNKIEYLAIFLILNLMFVLQIRSN